MCRYIYKIIVRVIILTWCLSIQLSLAIDGDVEYSAPYIMVDPETGQIVTVNPGPKPKAHEVISVNEEPSEIVSIDSVPENTNLTESAKQFEKTYTTLPIITIYILLFMVIMGFLFKKKNQKE